MKNVQNELYPIPSPEPAEETQLLKAFLDGQPYAFSLIYKKYVNVLFAYGMGMGVEREKLKDAIQDVFFKLYENRRQLGHVTNLKFYLLRMLKNYLLDLYRKQQDRYDISSEALTFTMHTTVLDDLITREEEEGLRQRIDHLLQTLTDRQREAVYLRFIQEMEYEEIGELLDMTPQASRKLIFRAIKRLREQQIDPLILLLFFYP